MEGQEVHTDTHAHTPVDDYTKVSMMNILLIQRLHSVDIDSTVTFCSNIDFQMITRFSILLRLKKTSSVSTLYSAMWFWLYCCMISSYILK